MSVMFSRAVIYFSVDESAAKAINNTLIINSSCFNKSCDGGHSRGLRGFPAPTADYPHRWRCMLVTLIVSLRRGDCSSHRVPCVCMHDITCYCCCCCWCALIAERGTTPRGERNTLFRRGRGCAFLQAYVDRTFMILFFLVKSHAFCDDHRRTLKVLFYHMCCCRIKFISILVARGQFW